MGLKPMLNYAGVLLKHKWHVFMIGLKVGGVPFWRLILHDWTKFMPREFGPCYRHHEVNDNRERELKLAAYKQVCAEHYKRHRHHWQYWIDASGNPLPVPEPDVREMVVDWIAVSRSYADADDAATWLARKHATFTLHPITIERLNRVLAEVGVPFQFEQHRAS